MRQIDADKLIDTIKRHNELVTGKGLVGQGYALAHEHIIDIIEILAKETEKGGEK